METISPKVRNEAKMSSLSTLIQYSSRIPTQSIKGERNKIDSNREGRSQIIPICR
jgi:hypothetical protein